MPNPVRNHLSGPGWHCKTGDRMDSTAKHLTSEIKRLLHEYKCGLIIGTQLARELDAVCALVTLDGTTLPDKRLHWEASDVDQWLPQEPFTEGTKK